MFGGYLIRSTEIQAHAVKVVKSKMNEEEIFCQNKRVVGNHCVKTKVCGK